MAKIISEALSWSKRRAKLILAKRGYRLTRIESLPPLDMRRENDPRAYNYHHGQSVLVEGEVDHGRGLGSFALSAGGPHPFVRAVRAGLSSKHPLEAIKESLASYYAMAQPQNAAERLGLSSKDCPQLSSVTPRVLLLPWQADSVQQLVAWTSREHRAIPEYGAPVEAPYSLGNKCFGPSSPELLLHEASRLQRTLASIQETGYVRHDGRGGDPDCHALYINDKWRWVVGRGEHRVPVLAALGWASIPIRIGNIVRREEVKAWPNVRSGLFTEEIALKIFDDYFYGYSPLQREEPTSRPGD